MALDGRHDAANTKTPPWAYGQQNMNDNIVNLGLVLTRI